MKSVLHVADPPWTIHKLGIIVGLVSVASFFTALILVYFFAVRSQVTGAAVSIPPAMWLATALLVLSSATLESARHALRRARVREHNTWLRCTLALGVGFVALQTVSWWRLVQQGVYIAGNPRGSVFYVFTGLHALHVLGGLWWLGYLYRRSPSLMYAAEGALRRRRSVTGAASIYWHFMGVLWAVLFGLLLIWSV